MVELYYVSDNQVFEEYFFTSWISNLVLERNWLIQLAICDNAFCRRFYGIFNYCLGFSTGGATRTTILSCVSYKDTKITE